MVKDIFIHRRPQALYNTPKHNMKQRDFFFDWDMITFPEIHNRTDNLTLKM